MFEIMISAVGGVMIGTSIALALMKWKMIRLKSENIMLIERNIACSDENVVLISKLMAARDKNNKTQRDLLMWELLANEIAHHPTPNELPVLKTAPEKGIQLLNYYKNQLK